MANSQANASDKDVDSSADTKFDWKHEVIKYIHPVIAKSIDAIKAKDPRAVLHGTSHKWYAVLLALIGAMILTIGSYCSGQYVPYRYPFDVLIDHLAPFVTPTLDYVVITQLLLYPIGLGCVCYFICRLCSKDAIRQVAAKNKRSEEDFVRALGVACVFLASSWVFIGAIGLAGLSWAIEYFVRHNFKSGWQLVSYLSYDTLAKYATCLFIVVMPFKIRKIFVSAKVQLVRPLAFGFAISVLVSLFSMAGATIIFDQIGSVYVQRGQLTNKIHELPVAGVIQLCTHDSLKINCTISLYPERQQNFEYFGTWTLGRYPQSGTSTAIMMESWQSALQSGKNIPTISVDEKKDISVDISVDKADLCKKIPLEGGETDSFFFFVKGRIKGEQSVNSKDLRIHIENDAPKFAQLINAACM